MNCPHCQEPIFLKSAGGTKLKARTNILVLHPTSHEAEINCLRCGGAIVLGKLEVALRKARPRLVIRPA